ncbi:hypothetical protein [Edaphobacter aggregans]|nr:hypothetical protein [Edaphobacter aggregans]
MKLHLAMSVTERSVSNVFLPRLPSTGIEAGHAEQRAEIGSTT